MIVRSGWSTDLKYLGWGIASLSANLLWGPVFVLWGLRFLLEDNSTVNWLFVMFSNLSMLGPVLLYWLAAVLIPAGWILDSFGTTFNWKTLLKWMGYLAMSVVTSYYQEAWIENIRDLYLGDGWTFEEELGDLNETVEDTIVDDGEVGSPEL